MAGVDRSTNALLGIGRELFTVSKFTLVGGVAAIVHIGIVWVLIRQGQVQPLLANLIAFLVAFLVSFTGQYLWTFRSSRIWHSAFLRFFLVSISAFLVNNLVLYTLLRVDFISQSLSAVVAAMTIPVFTYFLGRFWAFN